MYGNSGNPSNATELFIEFYNSINQLCPPCGFGTPDPFGNQWAKAINNS